MILQKSIYDFLVLKKHFLLSMLKTVVLFLFVETVINFLNLFLYRAVEMYKEHRWTEIGNEFRKGWDDSFEPGSKN